MSLEQLQDKLSSSFIVFENELNGETKTELHQKRRNAMMRFEQLGFPTTRHEEWKYTNLKPILKHDYRIFQQGEHALEFKDVKRFFLHDIDTFKLIFVDGQYSSWLSETTHQGYDVCTFSAALQRHRHVLDKYFGTGFSDPTAPVSLNTAFAREGAFIRIAKNMAVEKPIEIIHFTTGEAGAFMNQPRNLIVLEEGAGAQIIERHQNLGSSPVFSNAASEVFVERNAHLQLYRIQNDSAYASLVDSTAIHQWRDSRVQTGTFTFGGRFVRNDLEFVFEEENAIAYLDGLTLIGEKEFADHHTLVDHRVPHCESHEYYKGIYDENARGVFNGKVMVRQHAQKTNAFQENKNILLGDKASVDTKPQLEIYADDVKCSHGCTVGQLDEEALFYLRSRGIGEHESKALLLYAFGDEIIQRVKIGELRKRLHKLMARKLQVDFQMDL